MIKNIIIIIGEDIEMKYKMVAIDLDGTLLNRNKEITASTKETILKAQNKGVKVALATGRIYRSALLYAQFIGLNTPVIACNGAIMGQVDGKNIFNPLALDKNVIIKAAKICKELDIVYYLYTKEKIYVDKNIEFFRAHLLKELQVDAEKYIHMEQLNNIDSIKNIDEDIYKMTIYDSKEEKIDLALNKINQIKDAFVTSSSARNIELTNIKATKGNALKRLAEFYNIKQSEIIAIGDSYNDHRMIEYAGLGVAMGNAREDIKLMADYITLSNENEGVAKVFNKFIL